MFQQLEGRRRGHFHIISDILSTASDRALITEIMQKAGLSYAQLKRYVPMLIRTDLLTMSNRKNSIIYKTTRKGKDFLKRLQKLDKLLESASATEQNVY